MDYDVVDARYVRDHIVWVRCRDGRSGEVDLQDALQGPIFEPLKDVGYFRKFTLNPELRTLTWPNGADIAPESFHQRLGIAVSATSGDPEYAHSSMSSHGNGAHSDSIPVSVLRRAQGTMPEISRFYGIVVTMFYNEHGVPHFHAQTGEHEISVEIETLFVRGDFPGASLRRVLDWAELHRAELLANWQRARAGLALVPIDPLP